MVSRPSKRVSLIAGGSVVVLIAAGATAVALASGGDKTPAGAVAGSSVPPSAVSSSIRPSPSPSVSKINAVANVNPLTGIGPRPTGPVLGVKIDDTENGRPQGGVDKADVVYIEQAEGGLTRVLAVFASKKPTVEAVRSVRASDPELLRQYGKISLVASGGGGDSLITLDASAVTGVINDRGGPGFDRDNNRPAPYNLTSDLNYVSGQVKTGGVQDIGFHFRAVDARVKVAPVAATVNGVVGSTAVTFVWDAKLGIYVRTLGGQRLTAADGGPVGGANVLVQYCQVSVNRNDVDVMGNPSQYTHSVGTGRATLYRNGKRLEGTWSRPDGAAPTTFKDAKGRVLYLSPGSTFVLLSTA